MDFVTIQELKTHLYEEIMNEIVRDDNAIINDAIATGIDEVKGYIAKYDLDAIFKYTTSATYPTITPWLAARNMKLLSVVKDVTCWHIIRLSNPNIELPLRRVNYEDALSWLQRVQAGKIDPLLPVPAPSNVALGNGGTLDGGIKWESNYKRNNHF